MTHQVALVAGANKGIGFAIARQLAEIGYMLWLGCRDQERGEEACDRLQRDGFRARAVCLDVTDTVSITAAARAVGSETPALDVLVNNAGMHFGLPPRASEESIEQMREMFDVNALGPLRVTQAFLPLLRAASGARVVMMSSGLGSIDATADMTSENWTVGFAGYCASKTALNMLTLKLAKDLMAEGIKVNAADPGLTATDLTGHMGDRAPLQTAV